MLRSGVDLFVDAEVLFDRGDASKGVIDFLTEAGHVVEVFLEVVEFTADRLEFRRESAQVLRAQSRGPRPSSPSCF
jgi:hypothetical protein